MIQNITANRDQCIGSENRARYAPNTFATDKEIKVVVLDGDHDDDDTVRLAVSSCPVAALSVDDD